MKTSIGFIGTGQMATALATGIIKSDTVTSDEIYGYDIYDEAVKKFVSETQAKASQSVKDLVIAADVIFLSVKPQQMGDVIKELGQIHARDHNNPLWITIAAGIPISTYLKVLGTSSRLVRVMPNTPCLVGEGVSGFCVSEGATESDVELARSLLSTVGIAIQFPERQLDAVTGLSGSGPAYIYMMIEAMADGGVKMGLSRKLALKLAVQTIYGSAKVALQTGEHPGILKDKVCSPRGTTISAVHFLEQNGFRSTLMGAVEAATLRSRELASE